MTWLGVLLIVLGTVGVLAGLLWWAGWYVDNALFKDRRRR